MTIVGTQMKVQRNCSLRSITWAALY